MKAMLQRVVGHSYVESGDRSYDWAGRRVASGKPQRLLDVGCGNGGRLFQYLDPIPKRFCGVEGHPGLAAEARARGIEVASFDLNGRWPYGDGEFDAVHASQVIEHVHNTRMFVSEALRVLAPGGWAFMTSENLTSWMNTLAAVLGFTPFSLQQTCGWYLGNPLGLHAGEDIAIDLTSIPPDDPAFSGISGHVRVLGCRQAEELFLRVGFSRVEVTTIGLLPLPAWIGRPLERVFKRRGHWLMMEGQKATERSA
jgi:SAM-dependent methyltransferase